MRTRSRGQERHGPGEAKKERQQDRVPHGVDNPALGSHIPDKYHPARDLNCLLTDLLLPAW